jgi:hypothetical protein
VKKRLVAIVLPALFCGSHLLGRDVADAPIGKDVEAGAESKWEFTISATTYVPLHDQDYVNPTIVADRDWLHLEARYNYEALKTGSLWLGCNWAPIKDFDLTITPMIGGVFGNSTGVAPGYNIMTEYRWIEFFTQGEYFIDAGTHENNFFYSWSELSVVPMKWFRAGLVVQRTKAIGTTIDVQRGPLLGLRYRNIDLNIYWLSPGNHSSTFVFALGTTF